MDGGDDLSHVYLSYGSAGGVVASGRPRTARGNGRPKSGKPKSKR